MCCPPARRWAISRCASAVPGRDATLENALSMCTLFGLKRDAAIKELRSVVAVVAGWKAHFEAAGVGKRDIESYAEQIDRPFLLEQRAAFSGRQKR